MSLVVSTVAFVPQPTFVLQTAQPIRPRLRSTQVTMMADNLVDRFFRVVKSNVGAVISKFEDPEKVLEQAVIDMNEDLRKVRQSYAEITATQKRVERQRNAAADQAAEWMRRAQLAVEKGEEDLAREALQRKVTLSDQVKTLEEQMRLQGEALEQLQASMRTLEMKINEARSKKDQLIARARTAKTAQQVTDMLSGMGLGKTSMDAFERMQEKVETLESKAEVSRQMSLSSGTVEDKFKSLEEGSGVDAELQKLKASMGKTSKEPAQLKFASPEVEAELAQIKNKMQ